MMDQMKMLGALGGLLKNKDRLRGVGDRIKSKMASTKIHTEAGNGVVKVITTGEMRVESISVDPSMNLADAGARRTAMEMIALAVNEGITQAQQKMKAAVDIEMKELGLPGGLPDMGGLGNLLG